MVSARLPHELAIFMLFDGSDMIVVIPVINILIWSKPISALSWKGVLFSLREALVWGFMKVPPG